MKSNKVSYRSIFVKTILKMPSVSPIFKILFESIYIFVFLTAVSSYSYYWHTFWTILGCIFHFGYL